MIVTTTEKLGRCKTLSKNFADAIAWIESGAWRTLADGRFPIDGTRIHGMIKSGETLPQASCFYETHRRYADIQILLEGSEHVFVCDAAGLKVKEPYAAANDIEFLFDDPGRPEQRVVLAPGIAAVFFPEDAHKPSVAVSAPAGYRKLVVKVEVA
jgi:biofilm protein TabA